MSFTSQDNKRLLWGLMSDSNVFAGIPDTKVEEVKQLFEKEILDISNTSSNLLDKNKKILLSMNTKLNYLRVSNIPQQTQNQNELVTSKDIAQERREKMNSKLQNKQEEFNKLITAEKPKEIDFADNAEEKPIGSEMDNLLADMMEKRSKQLNQVMQSQDTNAAEKWINNEGAGAEITSGSVNTSGPVTLNIGEKVETPTITVVKTSSEIKDKHVTFSEDTKEEESGLDLFQFLSVKSNSGSSNASGSANASNAPFMPPQEENEEDIKAARAAAWASARRDTEKEILERLSRIEREFIEVKDLLKNM